ncbi:sterol-sensing domain of SREBP cleavage-activation-domain-containing protein [Gaertneriomyces semiglobifer]|nr:sterol-sensing domain of SREBP cleavage-activation-domain-containing protein [Gaertneriomyces semiglobifer]
MSSHTVEKRFWRWSGPRPRAFFDRLFYSHGLFCASHPYLSLFFCFSMLFFLSSPILKQFQDRLTRHGLVDKAQLWDTTSEPFVFRHTSEQRLGLPLRLRLQQVVIRAPDSESSSLGVLEPSLLRFALDLQEIILGSTLALTTDQVRSDVRFADICFRHTNDQRCLTHSLLEQWGSERVALLDDSDVLETTRNHATSSSFGVPITPSSTLADITWDTSGSIAGAESLILSFFIGHNTTRPLVDVWNANVIQDVEGILASQYPHLHVTSGARRRGAASKIVTYGVEDRWLPTHSESLVLGVVYIIVFLYISLVVAKFDLVKSKVLLGLGAVVTVFAGLVMSVGLCCMLGVKISIVPWEALPFLIIIVGLENISVLTNAVVTTSLHLPVKERVGLGLEKVGVRMSLSLGGEMCLLLVSSLMDVPALQEFCLFGAVSIVMDYLMQITFFISILAIDIRRLELADLHQLHSKSDVAAHSSNAASETGSAGTTQLKRLPKASRRPYWGSYVIIVITVLLLSLGLYRTPSSAMVSPKALGRSLGLSIGHSWVESNFDRSAHAVVETVCRSILQDKAPLVVHIDTPVVLRLSNAVEGRPSIVPESQSQDILTSRVLELRSHPVFFTMTVVAALLCATLLSILCTNLWCLPHFKRAADDKRHTSVNSIACGEAKSSSGPTLVQEATLMLRAADADMTHLKIANGSLVFPQRHGVLMSCRRKEDTWETFEMEGRFVGNVELFCRCRHKSASKLYAMITADGGFSIWDVCAGKQVIREELHWLEHGDSPTAMSVDLVGTHIYVCLGTKFGSLFIFRLSSSVKDHRRLDDTAMLMTKTMEGDVSDVQSDGLGNFYVVAGGTLFKARVSVATSHVEWNLLYQHSDFRVSVVCVDVQARLVVAGTNSGRVVVLDLHNEVVLGTSSDESAHDARIARVFVKSCASWTRICTVGEDTSVRIWELAKRRNSRAGPWERRTSRVQLLRSVEQKQSLDAVFAGGLLIGTTGEMDWHDGPAGTLRTENSSERWNTNVAVWMMDCFNSVEPGKLVGCFDLVVDSACTIPQESSRDTEAIQGAKAKIAWVNRLESELRRRRLRRRSVGRVKDVPTIRESAARPAEPTLLPLKEDTTPGGNTATKRPYIRVEEGSNNHDTVTVAVVVGQRAWMIRVAS